MMRSLLPAVDFARRYGTAIAAVAITVVVKLLVNGLGEDHPCVLLPVPVAIAAWYGGRGPGLIAAVLVPIIGTFFLGGSADIGDGIALGVGTIEAVIVVLITAGLKNALRRAEESRRVADDARRELSFAVAVRDEVLRLWHEKVRGPLGRLELRASEALATLERDGYRGAATSSLRAVAFLERRPLRLGNEIGSGVDRHEIRVRGEAVSHGRRPTGGWRSEIALLEGRLRFELLTREPEDERIAFGRVGHEIVLADDDLAFEEATCSDNESGHALSGRVDQRSADVSRVMPVGGLHPGVEIDAHALLRPLGALPPTPGSYLSTTCSNFPRGS